MPFGVLRMDFPFDYGKQMIQVIPSYPKELWILLIFALYGGMMPPSLLIRKKLSIVSFLNMWSFGKWGCARMKPRLKGLVPTWFIGKTSLSCYHSKFNPLRMFLAF
jgi:hypothetical protein